MLQNDLLGGGEVSYSHSASNASLFSHSPQYRVQIQTLQPRIKNLDDTALASLPLLLYKTKLTLLSVINWLHWYTQFPYLLVSMHLLILSHMDFGLSKPSDLLWPMEKQQTWCKQSPKKAFAYFYFHSWTPRNIPGSTFYRLKGMD